MKKNNITEDVHNDSEEQVTAAPGGLTIQDLRILKMSVEVSTSRGGFQANEISTVGNTYNKLASFLAQIDAQNATEEENAEETDEENTEETAEETAEE